MTPQEHLAMLGKALPGKRIARRILATNTLALDIGGSGEQAEYVLWIDPTWRLSHAGRVVAGSRQAQDDENDTGFQTVSVEVSWLVGRSIESFVVDPATGDLRLVLDGDFELRTFAADPQDTYGWHIDDRASGQQLFVSSDGARHEGAA